jgi:hypothetical protein
MNGLDGGNIESREAGKEFALGCFAIALRPAFYPILRDSERDKKWRGVEEDARG